MTVNEFSDKTCTSSAAALNQLRRLALSVRPTGQLYVRQVDAQTSKACGARALVLCDELRNRISDSNMPRAGHGGLPSEIKFGPNTKRRISDLCGALEEEFGKKCVFGTVTIPGSGADVQEVVCRWSASIVERVMKWIQRKIPGAHMLWVWEYQERGMLHGHVVVGSHDVESLRLIERGWKSFWISVLRGISDSSGFDIFKRADGSTWANSPKTVKANCRPVRKSVRRYMAKYLSKSVTAPHVKGKLCPTRWYAATEALRSLTSSLTHCVVSTALNASVAQAAQEAICGFIASYCQTPSFWRSLWKPGRFNFTSQETHANAVCILQLAKSWIDKHLPNVMTRETWTGESAEEIGRDILTGDVLWLRRHFSIEKSNCRPCAINNTC